MLTQERLKECLKYNPDTGLFTRNFSECRWKAGTISGCLEQQGYIVIRVDKKTYKAHRLAWLYMTGEFPKAFIDHINCYKVDNRYCNLREATPRQNKQNSLRRIDNLSGRKGIGCQKHNAKFRARIFINGASKHLGYFNDKELAHEAYCQAAIKYHGEFANFGQEKIC